MTENEYVDQYFKMDPETDDLIRGYDLKDGMKVLIEDYNWRMNTNETLSGGMKALADIRNRWTTVTNLDVEGSNVNFIGVYDDGTKATITRNENMGWYVKKDSLLGTNEHSPIHRLCDELDKQAEKLGIDGLDVRGYKGGHQYFHYTSRGVTHQMKEGTKPYCRGTECSVDEDDSGFATIHRGDCKLNNKDPHPTRVDNPVYVPETNSIQVPLPDLDEALGSLRKKLEAPETPINRSKEKRNNE
jgi:hypothetical protein